MPEQRTYQALQEQSIFDVALMQYGSLEGGLAALLTDNPALVQAGGIVGMFGATYKVRKPVNNENTRMRTEMQRIVPVTEGGVSDLGAWFNPNYVPWVTTQSTAWITSGSIMNSGTPSTGVRPDLFIEELDPSDANFEVYSQYQGVNRKAKLSRVGPHIASIGYTPTANGNSSDLNTVVTDPNGQVWFIAGNGDAIQLGSTSAAPNEVREEYWITGGSIITANPLPLGDTAARLKIYRGGVKLREGSDYTFDASINKIYLAIDADNEVFEIFITL